MNNQLNNNTKPQNIKDLFEMILKKDIIIYKQIYSIYHLSIITPITNIINAVIITCVTYDFEYITFPKSSLKNKNWY